MKYLFVYGTLQSNAINPLKKFFNSNIELVKMFEVPGKIYLVENPGFLYPAMVKSDEGTVHGELYKVLDNSIFEALDYYEGPNYSLEEVSTYKSQPVYAYVFNNSVENMPLIESGNFLEFLN